VQATDQSLFCDGWLTSVFFATICLSLRIPYGFRSLILKDPLPDRKFSFLLLMSVTVVVPSALLPMSLRVQFDEILLPHHTDLPFLRLMVQMAVTSLRFETDSLLRLASSSDGSTGPRLRSFAVSRTRRDRSVSSYCRLRILDTSPPFHLFSFQIEVRLGGPSPHGMPPFFAS